MDNNNQKKEINLFRCYYILKDVDESHLELVFIVKLPFIKITKQKNYEKKLSYVLCTIIPCEPFSFFLLLLLKFLTSFVAFLVL